MAAGLHKQDGLDVITGETIREIYVQLDRYDSHYRHFILAKKNDCHNADYDGEHAGCDTETGGLRKCARLLS